MEKWPFYEYPNNGVEKLKEQGYHYNQNDTVHTVQYSIVQYSTVNTLSPK